MNDQSLSDVPTPDEPSTPFGNPNGVPVVRQLTLEDVLTSARRHEKVARICIKADLQAEHDELVEELASMVNAQGELIVDPESAIGEQSAAERAQELADRLAALRREMRGSMWSVRFRAMPSDEWQVFFKKEMPAEKNADMTPFNIKMIAACAVDPPMTEAEVTKLRSVLGLAQWVELANKAWAANTAGGVDVPKSPVSLLNHTRQ